MSLKNTSNWSIASLVFSLVGAAVLLLAGYGYQWGWWGLGTAFSWLLPGSGVLGVIGILLALVFGFVRWYDPTRKGGAAALLSVVLALGVIGTLGYWYNEAQKYPPIHDISTDIEDPPQFRDIVPLRAEASNDTTYGGQEKAAIQREHYPDIQTLYLDVTYPEAFSRALDAARQMPWERIVTADEEAGLIEAVDKLAWFGFKDDVVIRVDTTDAPGRTKVDVRSVSRIGQGDIGVNAHRVREYLETFQNQ